MAKKHFNIPELTATDIGRFWSKVAPTNKQGCALWTAGRDERGYGRFRITRGGRRRQYLAHRIAYFLHYGKQPNELLVCHNCPNGDNPSCVAAQHLFLGTQAENMQDAARKGRTLLGDRNPARLCPERMPRGHTHYSRLRPACTARGERAGNVKLTEEKVRQIRSLQGTGKLQREIGAAFGVDRKTVGDIWRQRSWKHVE